MTELAKRFIGKECLIYMLDSQVNGVIQEVTEGGLVLAGEKETQIVNLDFVLRIREYPRKKNGKKASVVLD